MNSMTLRAQYVKMMNERYGVPKVKLVGKSIPQMSAMATKIEKRHPSTGLLFVTAKKGERNIFGKIVK